MKRICCLITMLYMAFACNPDIDKGLVETKEIVCVTNNSAKILCNVASGGESVVIAKGVCWSTNSTPTISDMYTVDGNGIGDYISEIKDLTHNTVYYVRAYATNARGVTSYGEEMSFQTLDVLLPTVTTNEVCDVTPTTAICGGNVTFDGNLDIVDCGVCWSIEKTPTIDDNKMESDIGECLFTIRLINLLSQTTYYVRAYATNEVGTSYGEEISFTTKPSTGMLNGYEWVDLGLPSGLKWASCNVGAFVPEESGGHFAWGEISTKNEYSYSNSLTYGKTMNDISGDMQYDVARASRGDGWRMPTCNEIKELVNNCTWEMIQHNGVYGQKITGPCGNYIFLPLAGFYNGAEFSIGGEKSGSYWTSTPSEDKDEEAWNLYFSGDYFVGPCDRSRGQSVRPVTD